MLRLVLWFIFRLVSTSRAKELNTILQNLEVRNGLEVFSAELGL